MRLLYAEDERDLNEVVTRTLLKNHYSVDSCFDGEEALDCLAAAEYDAVILDIMMPRVDGLTVLSRLRARGNRVPVLLLTARDGVSDRVKGLDSGADDYLVKPFSYSELISRVKAMLRRYYVYGAKQTELQSVIRCCGTVEIDPRQCVVRQEGREVPLTDTEYRILLLLASHPAKVFSVQNIYESVWNEPYFYSSNNTVMVHIRNIRRKLGDDPQNSRTIRTVWGRGYRIE